MREAAANTAAVGAAVLLVMALFAPPPGHDGPLALLVWTVVLALGARAIGGG